VSENITQKIEALRGERKAEAARLRAAGHSLRAIGERIGVSAPVVLGYLRELAADDPDDGAAGAEKLAPSVGGYSTEDFLKAVPRS
jgi:transposase